MMNLNLFGSFVEHFVLMFSILAVNDSQFLTQPCTCSKEVQTEIGSLLLTYYLLHFLTFSLLFSLKYINVAMLTILKNVANVLTASGETYFFKKQHGTQVWIALLLMVCHIHIVIC